MKIDFDRGMAHFSGVFAKQVHEPPACNLAIERLAAIKVDVDTAEGDGIFVPLPVSEPEGSKDHSRFKTIRNRLFILGYLEKDTGRGNIDATLKKAIRAFQKEAGLEEDGWVGEEETWPALQELVSFETPINLLQWFNAAAPKPALRRAVALRLFVLGLREKRPTSFDEDIESGLLYFGRIWQILNLGETQSPPGLNLEWLELLFDMDGLTRRLSEARTQLTQKELMEVHSLVINAAKIELWLMGYPVRPSGYDLEKREISYTGPDDLTALDVWTKSKTVTQYYAVKRRIKFHKALHRFWIDHGRDDKTADQSSVNFLQNFPQFFQIVDEGLRTDKDLSTAHRQEDLEAFIKDRREQIPLVWETLKKIGARIWDGVRRVWGWFKRMITTFKNKVLEIGTNLSRIIYDFALGSFTVVANVFKSFGTAIEFIIKPIMPGSNAEHVVFFRDLDFDPKVVIQSSADRRNIANCCETLLQKTRLFTFGCHVIGTFVSILSDTFKAGWTAYFGLVFALIKFRRVKYKFKSLADEYRRLFPAAL